VGRAFGQMGWNLGYAVSIARAGEPRRQDAQRTVLVVEDEVLIRLMLADALRAQGLTVIEASNGDEALSVLQSSTAVHLLLTDIQLPSSIDGAGLARFVRTKHPDLKLVIASGHRIETDLMEAADALFAKPYDVNAVVRRVRALLVDQA
jgi:CheY-like chemotaxis protein